LETQNRSLRTFNPFQALALTVMMAALALWAGCAIPSDIHERSDALTDPSLDRTLVTPSPDEIVELTSTVTEFSVAAAIDWVEDGDDELYFEWFVGYPESAVPVPPVYDSQKTIQFNACAFKDILVPDGSTDTIELFISREPLGFDATEGRTTPEWYIYLSWQVRMKVSCE